MADGREETLTLIGFAIGIGLFLLALLFIFIYLWKVKRLQLLEKQRKKSEMTKTSNFVLRRASAPIETIAVPIQLDVGQFRNDYVEKTRNSDRRRQRAATVHEAITESDMDLGDLKPRRVLSESEMAPIEDLNITRKSISERGDRRSIKAAIRRKSRSICLSYPICPTLRVSGLVDFMVHYNSSDKELEIVILQLYDIDLSAQNCVGLLGVANPTEYQLNPKSDDIYIIRDIDGSLCMMNEEKIGLSVTFALYPKGSFTKKTSVKYGSESPSFNETFVARGVLPSFVGESVLRIQALAHFHEKVGAFSIGEVAFPLRKINFDTYVSKQELLDAPLNDIHFELSLREDRYVGELGVAISYDALGNRLSIMVVGASNLPRAHGLPNCSVKTSVYFCRNRMGKEKTKIVRRCDHPDFHETHKFDIAQDKLSQVDMVFEIRQHGPIQKSVLGYVHIGCDADEDGKKQWIQLLEFTCINETMWHPIKRRKPFL